MRRRNFIALLGGAAAAWPVAAFAEQPPRKRPLLAYLITGTRDGLASDTSAFLNRLRDLGYIDGQNIEIVTRYADSNTARLPELADELIKLQPNVILAFDPPAAVAARKATASIPIVDAILNDPLQLGLIASYARPGGNVTGILSQVELAGQTGRDRPGVGPRDYRDWRACQSEQPNERISVARDRSRWSSEGDQDHCR